MSRDPALPPDLLQSEASLPLTERLQRATAHLHAAAERSPLMAALIGGALARRHYALLLRNLHALYGELERGLDAHAAHRLVAPIMRPELARSVALRRDLEALEGPRWERTLPLLPAAARYSRRLRLISAWCPPLLVAHAYVRYLGDLHGGQLLRRSVQRAYGGSEASPPAPTAFYEFGGGEADQGGLVARLIDGFRGGLLEIERRALSSSTSSARPATTTVASAPSAPAAPSLSVLLVREARDAFSRHRLLFAELERA